MRVVAVVVGAILVLIALPSALTGCGVVAGVGDGSRFDIPVADVRAPDAAVAVTTPEIDLTGITIPSWIADTSITLEIDPARDGTPMFGGIASAGDASAYLNGATVATVDLVEDASGSIQVDRDGLELEYTLTPGSNSLPVPGNQDFWISQTEDGRLRISLADLSGRRTAIVLMRADGDPGIVGEVEGALRMPLLRTAAIVLFIGGLIGTAAGAALIVIGLRRRASEAATSPPPTTTAGPTVTPPTTPAPAPAAAVDTGPPSSAPPAVDTRRGT